VKVALAWWIAICTAKTGMSSRVRAAPALALLLFPACTTGEGAGWVRSDRLVAANCWDGPFDLGPDFFASDPFQDTQQIRIQRGDRLVGVSDGVLIVVTDVAKIRAEQLNTPIPLGLPIGVTPPGHARRVGDPKQVSLSLYLNDTCHAQNPTVHSIGGTITFHSLFSGNRNENSADQRLTDAEFEAMVADPRDLSFVPGGAGAADGGVDAGGAAGAGDGGMPGTAPATSVVTGRFRFFFQRGISAQPFP
jgi:hypothetical protein